MMKKLLILAALLFSPSIKAAVSDVDKAVLDRGKQLLLNGGFESGKASWSASAGTYTTTTTAANVGFGSVAASWNASATSQTFTSTAVAIPSGLLNKNGYASCRIKVASGSATHTFTVDDGTNNLVTPVSIPSSTASFADVSVNFIYPASGNVRIKITSSADEPEIFIDDCFLGDAINVGTVAQARLVGTIKMTGCTDKWSTTSTTYATFATQTNCVYTTTGEAQAPSTNIPAIKFANLPAGEYRLEYEGTLGQLTAAKGANFRFSDGTNTSREESIFYNSAGEVDAPSLSQSITYTTPQSNVTLQIQAKTDSGGTAQIFGKTTINPGVIKVWYFPSSAQQVATLNTVAWKVDANISGANPSLGSAAVSSYTGIENASLTLTNNTGTGNIAAQIPCSSTNSPSGTTCSVGNESVGVSFNLPAAGDVMACASFTHRVDGGRVEVSFQIVETPNNAQTISQEGKSRIESGGAVSSGTTAVHLPHRLCGTFTFASAGQKTLRLMYEMPTPALTSVNAILGDADASTGQRDIHWEVYPITQSMPMPVLVGSVSTSSGAERIERIYFGGSSIDNDASPCAASPCTVHRQSGGVSSVTRSTTGVYVINWNTGVWSAPPTCTGNSLGSAVYDWVTPQPSTNTVSSTTIRAFQSNGTGHDSALNVICMGPR